MMKFIFTALIAFSFLYSLANHTTNEVSNAALTGCEDAVRLTITLSGSMALWGGVLRVAQKSGITDSIARIFTPLIKLLFKGINEKGQAFKAITMNITANLLGLGNAATPLGITAVKELAKEEGQDGSQNGYASDNIIMFVVLNTASIQLLPTTVAVMRLAHGSKTPLDILPAILLSSLISVCAGIIMCKAFSLRQNSKFLAQKVKI